MTDIEYLSRAFGAKNQAVELQGQIKRLDEAMVKIGTSITEGSKVQSSPPKDPMGDRVSDLVDEKDDRRNQLIQLSHIYNTAERIINRVDCVTCRGVLQKRYLEGKRLRIIAVEMGYSYRYVQDLHAAGMKEIKIPA